MPVAYADPQHLREFAHKLKAFAQDIDHYTNTVNGGMRRLGESWRDEYYYRFEEVFAEAAVMLHELAEASRELAPHLEHDAEIIDKRRPIK
ncbi:MAG: hypothetical protein V7641_4930 [Blastocatellia bacterium]